MANEIIKQLIGKGRNVRLHINVIKDDKSNIAFFVHTRRLVDAKLRQIKSTDNLYGVETLTVLTDVFNRILNDPKIVKEINKDMGFEKWTLTEYNKK